MSPSGPAVKLDALLVGGAESFIYIGAYPGRDLRRARTQGFEAVLVGDTWVSLLDDASLRRAAGFARQVRRAHDSPDELDRILSRNKRRRAVRERRGR